MPWNGNSIRSRIKGHMLAPISAHRDNRHHPQQTQETDQTLRQAEPIDRRRMRVRTVLEKQGGCVVGAELSCSVQEENATQRESYTADWQSINMKTQHEDRQSMLMSDHARHETLSRYWRARPLSQQCPSGVLRVGTVESGIGEHQLLPYRNTLPLPIFKPAELGTRLGRGAPHSLDDVSRAHVSDGLCLGKRDMLEITRDLPPVKPLRMEFAKAPITLGRSVSQEAQRG